MSQHFFYMYYYIDFLPFDFGNIVSPNFQKELISGDQNGNIRVWDLAANSCSCELVSQKNPYYGSSGVGDTQEHN